MCVCVCVERPAARTQCHEVDRTEKMNCSTMGKMNSWPAAEYSVSRKNVVFSHSPFFVCALFFLLFLCQRRFDVVAIAVVLLCARSLSPRDHISKKNRPKFLKGSAQTKKKRRKKEKKPKRIVPGVTIE